MSGSWKLLWPQALWLAALAACQLPPSAPPALPAQAPPPQPPQLPAPQLGIPYDVVPQASLLVILVYRGGALASAGHNHVIASHELAGTLYLPPDAAQGGFELHVPVATLTVDEATLRAQQPRADFPPDVSEGAKDGTRRNMLGAALLDAEHHPEIVLRAVGIAPADATGAATETGPRAVTVRVESTVRGLQRTFTVPVCYRLGDGGLTATGEFPLRQSELGLTPFSAMLGALQVQDEMRIQFHIVARRAVRVGTAPAAAAAPTAAPPAAPPDTPCAAAGS